MMKKGNAVVFLLFLLLVFISISTYLYLQLQKFNQSRNDKVVDQTLTDIKNTKVNTYLFDKFSSFGDVEIGDFPNLTSIRGVVKYGNSLWIVGDGKLVEFDTTKNKIVRVSSSELGYCANNLVLVRDYLYIPCHEKLNYESSQVVHKLNLKNYVLEKTFGEKDGLTGRLNYELTTDGSDIWITTNNGVGKIDSNDHVYFYKSELGITATVYSVSKILVDNKSIWVYVNANAYSQGGIARYDKTLQKWFSFGPNELREFDKSRFDATDIAVVEGGLISKTWEVGKCTIKKFLYSSNKFTNVSISSNFGDCGNTDVGSDYKTYTDENGFTQLSYLGKNYLIDGRVAMFLSPAINNRKYFITNVSIDRIDDISVPPMPVIKFGKNISPLTGTTEIKWTDNYVKFVTTNSDYWLVISTGCKLGGMIELPCDSPTIWLVDAKKELLVARFDSDNSKTLISKDIIGTLSAQLTGNQLIISNDGVDKLKIDLKNIKLEKI